MRQHGFLVNFGTSYSAICRLSWSSLLALLGEISFLTGLYFYTFLSILCRFSATVSQIETGMCLSVCMCVCVVQERLVKCHGIQCGFCSPGMVMSLYALLRNDPQPSKLQIEQAVQGMTNSVCHHDQGSHGALEAVTASYSLYQSINKYLIIY